jgi:hypothetical protein
MTEHKIELRKNHEVKWPGSRDIVVDGVVWGQMHAESVGPHGMRYHFVQSGRTGYIERRREGSTRLAGFSPVYVASDKIYNRTRPRDSEFVPLEQRQIAKIRELIAEGLLISPDAFAARIAEQRVKNQRAREAEELAKEKRLREIAMEELAHAGHVFQPTIFEDLVEATLRAVRRGVNIV